MGIEHELQRVGKIVAADQGLKVHVRGAAAFAVPGEVTIPSIDSYDRLGRFASRMLHGLCDHETSHARNTDFKVMGAARGEKEMASYTIRKYRYTEAECEDLDRLKGNALGTMLNAIEDGWIEQKQGRDWAGCKQNLNQKNRWWWEQDVREAGSSIRTRLTTSPPFEAYMLALTVVSRKSVTMGEIRDANPEIHQVLEATWSLVEQIDDLDNSGDALRLAMQILNCFDLSAEDEDPEGVGDEGDQKEKGDPEEDDEHEDDGDTDDDHPMGGDPEDDEDGEEEDTEGPESGGEPGDESEDGDDGEGPGEGSEGEDGDDTGVGEGGGDGEEDGEDGEGKDGDPPPIKGEFKIDVNDWEHGGRPLTPEDSISKVLHGVLEQNDYNRPYLVFSHEWDQELDLGSDDNSDLSRELDTVQKQAQESVGTLSSVFESALQARREKRPVPGADEGQADPNLLAAFSMGAVPVDEMYLQYVSEDDTDVATAILCDCSASTGSASYPGSVANVLRQTAVAMSQALSAAQLAHEVTGFTCIETGHLDSHSWFKTPERIESARKGFQEMRQALIDAQTRGTDVFKFARSLYGPRGKIKSVERHSLLVPAHAIFKGFSQTDLRGLMKITGIHENLDGEALLWQAQRLALRPEKRRVMFVLSDGLPLGSRVRAQGQRYLREVIERVTEAGIEVYAIGIKTSYVKEYYPHWWVVNDLDDLCQVAMTGLMEVLLTARQEHQWIDELSA